MALSEYYKLYLQYVVNTGGNGTIARFDDDWSPIGPNLRSVLMPQYIIENANKRLELTDFGKAALVEV
jgi:hypothetical protein